MNLLLLAGTSEARWLAERLAGEPGVQTIASLAGSTRAPLDLPVPTRVGGFGGRAAFEAFLEADSITAVVDATHPFAGKISRRTAEACKSLNMPYLQVLRPAWQPRPGDLWTFINNESQAADVIPKGSTVFLGTGRQTLLGYANLTGCRLICRRIDTPKNPFPLANGEYLVGRPPFSLESEIHMFRERKIDWLVVKNAGGTLSRTKLDAARELGLPVLMINRPPQPRAPRVETAAEALTWVRSLL